MRQNIRRMMLKEIPVKSPLDARLDLTSTMFLSLRLQIDTNVNEWREGSGEKLILTTKVSMTREEKDEQPALALLD